MTLPPGWQRCTLDDVKAPVDHAIAGGPFGSDLTAADYAESGVPVIRGCNLGHGERRFYPDDLVFVADAKADALRRSLALPGDVLFTQRGTVGQVGLVPADLPWPRLLLSQSQMKLTCDPARADPEYVYYWCRGPEAQQHMQRSTISAGVPHTNLAALRRTPIALPPLAEQRAIAATLSALDRRISLCADQQASLGALVDLLFRAWFLDHDPVRSKAAGARHPSVDPEAHALFPARLVEQGGRPVPEGWSLAPLTDLAEFQNGSPFALADFCEPGDGLPVVKIAELKQGVTRQTRFSRGSGGARAIARGDLLFSWSGNPDTSIDLFLYGGAPAWLNQHIYKVVPPRRAHGAWLFGQLRALKPTFIALARARQTTGLGHVALKDLRALLVVAPPEPVLAAFDRATAPYLERLLACADLSAALARTRDALLPALLSAETRVAPFARA